MKRTVVLILFLALAAGSLHAQQLYNFSNVRENAMVFNPAITGTALGTDIWITGRKQWLNIDNSPFTGVASVQAALKKNVGLGGHILYDQSGPTSQIGFAFNFAYHLNLNKQFYNRKAKGRSGKMLSFGLSGALYQYRINTDDVIARDADDILLATNPTAFYPDASFGIYYQSRRLFAGFSIPQLLNLEIKLNGDNQTETTLKKISHYHYYVGYKFRTASEKFEFQPTLWFKHVVNAPPQADIMLRFWMYDLAWLGLNYRTTNTMIFEAGVRIKDKFTIGYAYDFEFEDYRPLQGQNHEIMLGIHFGKEDVPKTPPVRKKILDPTKSFEETRTPQQKAKAEKQKIKAAKEKEKAPKAPKTKAPKPTKEPKEKTPTEPKKKKGEKTFDDY